MRCLSLTLFRDINATSELDSKAIKSIQIIMIMKLIGPESIDYVIFAMMASATPDVVPAVGSSGVGFMSYVTSFPSSMDCSTSA